MFVIAEDNLDIFKESLLMCFGLWKILSLNGE